MKVDDKISGAKVNQKVRAEPNKKMLPLIVFTIFLSLSTAQDGVKFDQVTCSNCICQNTTESITLNCNNRGLRHVLSNWPQDNISIIANFAYNNITTLERLPGSDGVIEVVFSHCGIRYITPNAFESVRNIKFLDLSYNLLTNEELSPDKFNAPTTNNKIEYLALEHLNLAYNRIHSLHKDTFEKMPLLKHLNLEGNYLEMIDLHTQLAISSIKSLEILNLANNKLSDLIEGAIANMKLKEINLARNELDFVPKELSLVGYTLEKLILDDNPILELNDQSFLGLHNLRELSINNLTNVTYYGPNTFVPMLKLRKLQASNNPQLRGIEREAFGPNQTLQEVYLNNNRLYKIDYLLLRWSELKVFQLKDNPLNCDCDLYNITLKLPVDITRNEDGPYCIHPETGRSQQMYYLKSDICAYKNPKHEKMNELMNHRFNMIRTSLVALSIVMIVILVIAISLGMTRLIRLRRNGNYPFAPLVSYNPLMTGPRLT